MVNLHWFRLSLEERQNIWIIDMLWIVQDNLYNEDGYVRFIGALQRLNCNYLIVKPVPFTNVLLPSDFDCDTHRSDINEVDQLDIDPNQPIVICGATSLSRISQSKGWYPGTFLNDNFDYEVWRDGFGAENLLNSDAVVAPVCELSNIHNHDMVFIRPVHDSKAISGTVMSADQFVEWQHQISQIDQEEFQPLHKNTVMLLSPVKQIYNEFRVFVVDGKVVTASMYKQGDQVRPSHLVDQHVIDFSQQMVDKWQPAIAFVIDVAETPQGLKIIEINNINSAGFYEADVFKIIDAIDNLQL